MHIKHTYLRQEAKEQEADFLLHIKYWLWEVLLYAFIIASLHT